MGKLVARFGFLTGFVLVVPVASSSLAQVSPDERPGLPFPPGVTVQSQCGAVDDLQDVEPLRWIAGVSSDYVKTNEPSTVQFQWLDEASIDSRLPDHSPGSIPGVRWCTGTLFTDRLILTAGHCFDQQRGQDGWISPFKLGGDGRPVYAEPGVLATLQVVNFGYQVNRDTGAIRIPDVYPIVRLVEHRNGGLDYAIVEIGPNSSGTLPSIALADLDPAEPVVGAAAGIIQHPQGLPKKIEAGKVFKVEGDDVLYNDIDTWGGSSGSGVRNGDGNVIGVHTNGGCETDANRGVTLRAISAVSDQF